MQKDTKKMTKEEILLLKKAAIILNDIAQKIQDTNAKIETLLIVQTIVKAVHKLDRNN